MEKREVSFVVNDEYRAWIEDVKSRIKQSRLKAVVKVNYELLELYWGIGRDIVEKQKDAKWGDAFLTTMSKDLKKTFPDMSGFSVQNLKSIRYWYKFYNPEAKSLQSVSQMKLPEIQSDLAQQTLKDPYNFDFLTLREEFNEKELESALINQITQFLLELGTGFAYLGRQVQLHVGESDFYMDLLFYHIRLRCYVVIELKTEKFKPEFAGKLNFYVTAVNKQMKSEQDNPTIGLLICKDKDNVVAEYSLDDISQPIGIAAYELTKVLREEFKSSLPTVEEIESKLSE